MSMKTRCAKLVDQRFQTVRDSELSISIKISGILVSELGILSFMFILFQTRSDSSWIEYIVSYSSHPTKPGRVNANRALKKFQKWLLAQQNLPKFDHAMAFTRYQLINRQSIDLGGLAYVKSICHLADASSSSIVSDPGDFQCVKVAAHELGHSLGATHDGDKKNPLCPPNDNFIMAPQTTNEHEKLKNAFYFSRCSINQMKVFLGTAQAKCVFDSPSIYYHYDLERRPPGQVFSVDVQCKLIFGKTSGFCDVSKY
ncbi:metalloprotease mig-17-like [Gigantopelta aegis]|uniref:metalloprotease mig-17-like n=1 Tax=Gigantopelta aegis TaxID=1735272 RepID=UPI001B88AF44|nr:metalloprotease mig-17-like [Gigantopelta aegis]